MRIRSGRLSIRRPFRIARVYAQNGIAGGLEIRYALPIPLSQRASGRMRSHQKRCGQAALDNIARVDCGLAPWMWCGFRHAGEFNLFCHSAVPSRNNTRRLPGYRQSFFGRITGSPAQFKPLIRLFFALPGARANLFEPPWPARKGRLLRPWHGTGIASICARRRGRPGGQAAARTYS